VVSYLITLINRERGIDAGVLSGVIVDIGGGVRGDAGQPERSTVVSEI
jgi:hypothetical protein